MCTHTKSNLYVLQENSNLLILVLYVNDILLTGNNTWQIAAIKAALCQVFDMTKLGLLHYCLGIEFWQTQEGICMSRTKYAKGLLQKLKMGDCKPVAPPLEKGIKLSKHDTIEKFDGTLYRQLVLYQARHCLCHKVA